MDKKTNNILVIGNGFDLANKYKTKYGHFISFIKFAINLDISYKENEETKEFREFLIENRKAFTSFESFEEFKKIAANNSFSKHFVKMEENLVYWVDVEEEIRNIISDISKVFCDDYEDNKYVKFDTFYRCYLQECDARIEKNLSEFGLIEDIPFFSKTKIKPGLVIEVDNKRPKLNAQFFDSVNKVNWNELSSYLENELNNFKKLLIIYLRDYVPKIKEISDDSIDELAKNQLLKINPDFIVTFNYTDFYKDIFDMDKIMYPIHVHGDFTIYNQIVLGYEDNDSISTRFIRFKKFFQCLQYKIPPLKLEIGILNEDYKLHNFIRFILTLKGLASRKTFKYYSKKEIHFYGVSFDITDDEYIKYLYNIKNSRKYFYYYNNNDYDRKMINLINLFGKDRILNDLCNGELFPKEIKNSENK